MILIVLGKKHIPRKIQNGTKSFHHKPVLTWFFDDRFNTFGEKLHFLAEKDRMDSLSDS